MKKLVTSLKKPPTTIRANFTADAETTARLFRELDDVEVGEAAIRQACDLIDTIDANTSRYSEYDRLSITAATILRYACYALDNQESEDND